MGRNFVPAYGKVELGSAIENAEKIISKVKTNKFTKADLEKLVTALDALKTAVEKYED